MKKFVFITLISFLLSYAVNLDAAEINYSNASRIDLLQEILRLTRELKSEKIEHRETRLELDSAYRDIQTIASTIDDLQQSIAVFRDENRRLYDLLEYPYQPWDISFDFYAGAGTAATVGIVGKLHFDYGLSLFIQGIGYYDYYMSANFGWLASAGLMYEMRWSLQ